MGNAVLGASLLLRGMAVPLTVTIEFSMTRPGAGVYGVPSSRTGTGAFGGPHSPSISGTVGCGGLIDCESEYECDDRLGEFDMPRNEECHEPGEPCGECECECDCDGECRSACLIELNETCRSRPGRSSMLWIA